MGILARALEKRNLGATLVPADRWRSTLAYGSASSGVTITPEIALQFSAVFACIRILAETVASLPLKIYRRLPGGGKLPATDHPLYPVLHDIANPEMTSFTLRETLMGHLGGRGNAYAEIEFTRGGEIKALWPLRPDMVEVYRIEGRIKYVLRMPSKIGGVPKVLDMDQVLHIKGLGSNGLIGYSPIAMARNSIGLGIAAEEFGARFFANDARPGAVLEHPGELSDKSHDRLKADWEEAHGGLENAHRIAILEEGMGLKEIGFSPEDSQFLETRKFQISEIARWYRVPPHMLADLDRATFSNIEHQSLEFVIHTMRPWLIRLEQEIALRLMTERERQEYFAEFLVAGLLRGDIQARYQAYATGRQNGWMSANDIRKLENMNPIDGGDIYMVPLNMIPADAVSDMRSKTLPVEERNLPQVERRERQAARYRHRLMEAHKKIFKDVAARILRREKNDVGAAARKLLPNKPLAEFEQWLEEFYREHEGFAAEQMRAVMSAYAELVAEGVREELGSDEEELSEDLLGFIQEYVDEYGKRHAGRSLIKLREKLEKAHETERDQVEVVEETLDDWVEGRPAHIAQEESVRQNNALAYKLYTLAGIRKLRSIATGKETCPYCSALDGKVIGIQEHFLPAGIDFMPEGAERPLTVTRSKRHPPYHGGCDCMVVASF